MSSRSERDHWLLKHESFPSTAEVEAATVTPSTGFWNPVLRLAFSLSPPWFHKAGLGGSECETAYLLGNNSFTPSPWLSFCTCRRVGNTDSFYFDLNLSRLFSEEKMLGCFTVGNEHPLFLRLAEWWCWGRKGTFVLCVCPPPHVFCLCDLLMCWIIIKHFKD